MIAYTRSLNERIMNEKPCTPIPVKRLITDLQGDFTKSNNKVISTATRIGRQARDALEPYGLEIFDTEISQRVAYIEAMISGL